MKLRPTIQIDCSKCGIVFQKDRREHARQTKKGRQYFYCGLGCAAAAGNTKTPRGTTSHLRKYKRIKDELSPFRNILSKIKGRGKGYAEDLDLLFLKELWELQKGRCALTNIPLTFGGSDKRIMASIDRIDSSLPYQQDNIQYVCVSINYAKNDMQNAMMVEFIEAVRRGRDLC